MKNRFIKLGIIVFFSLYSCSYSFARTIYVNLGATGANNGTSWGDAFIELTDALAASIEGDQIWITGGVYFPTHSNDRSASFVLKNGVALYGKFVGTETNLQERTFNTTQETVLSGDIGLLSAKNDNSFHVVKAENISNLVLDYISIKDGNANGVAATDKKGAGLYLILKEGSTNRVLTKNFSISKCDAVAEGGGAYMSSKNGSIGQFSMSFTHLESNSAAFGGSVFWDLSNGSVSIQGFGESYNLSKASDSGGGIYVRNGQKSSFTWTAQSIDCASNQATNKGGGLVVSASDSSVAKIDWRGYNGLSNYISENQSAKGGFVFLESLTGTSAATSLTLTNCQLHKMSAGSGGVVYNDDNQAQISLQNCTIDSCTAGQDGGVSYMNGGHLTIDNSDFDALQSGGIGSVLFFQAQEGTHQIDIRHTRFANMQSANSAFYVLADRNALIKPYFSHNYFIKSTSTANDVGTGFLNFRATGKNAKISGGKVIQSVFLNGKGYAGAVGHEALGGLCEVTYTHVLFQNNAATTATMLNNATNTEGTCTIINQNTLFWNNKNLSGGLGHTVANQKDNTTPKPRPTFSYCLMPESDCTALDQSLCNNNVFGQDPLLIQVYRDNPEYLEYAPCSPAINAGNNGLVPPELTFIDAPFRKDRRIVDGTVDIGASEYIGNNHEYAKILDEPNRSLFADKAYQDSLGWTHYYNCAEKKLILSIQTDSLSLGKLSDSLKVIMTTTADYGNKAKILRGADYLTNTGCDKWSVMNRFWQIRGARSLGRTVAMRFYFMDKDSLDLQKALPFTAYTDMVTYEVTKATAQDTIVKRIGGNFTKQTFTKVNASLSEWSLKPDNAPYFGNYRVSQFQVAEVNGSGSAGVLKGAGTLITEIDTFICHQLTVKVGDKELTPSLNPYTVILKNGNGCDSIVHIKVDTDYHFFSSSNGSSTPDIGNNTGTVQVLQPRYYTHRWNTGDTTYFIGNLKAGTYTDTVTGLRGCKDTFSVVVHRLVPYEIPNAFTPNGDGLNDTFNPVFKYWNSDIITGFKIYNRLGHLVYNNETPTTGWDGTIKGQEEASDVYVYLIEFDFGNGFKQSARGEVILIR